MPASIWDLLMGVRSGKRCGAISRAAEEVRAASEDMMGDVCEGEVVVSEG